MLSDTRAKSDVSAFVLFSPWVESSWVESSLALSSPAFLADGGAAFLGSFRFRYRDTCLAGGGAGLVAEEGHQTALWPLQLVDA